MNYTDRQGTEKPNKPQIELQAYSQLTTVVTTTATYGPISIKVRIAENFKLPIGN